MQSLGRGAFWPLVALGRASRIPPGGRTKDGRETTPLCGTATIYRFYSFAKNLQHTHRVLVRRSPLRALRPGAGDEERFGFARLGSEMLSQIRICREDVEFGGNTATAACVFSRMGRAADPQRGGNEDPRRRGRFRAIMRRADPLLETEG